MRHARAAGGGIYSMRPPEIVEELQEEQDRLAHEHEVKP